MKRAISAVALCALLIGILPAISAENTGTPGDYPETALIKDETVYACLDSAGEASSVYVVNRIETLSKGTYTDYGAYEDVTPLSGSQNPEVNGKALSWKLPASEDGFYYQGKLAAAELPYEISISYKLDGADITAEELAGKSGRVEIAIKITSNKNAAQYYRKNFVCQLQVPLSLAKCINIEAKGAQNAVVGETRTLAYMALPGRSAQYAISFDAKDFEMDGITAACALFDLSSLSGLDIGALSSDINDLSDGMQSLADGTSSAKNGAAELAEGANKLGDATKSLAGGAGELDKGVSDYTQGVSSLADGLKSAADGLALLSAKGEELSAGYAQLSSGIRALLDGLTPLLVYLPAQQQGAYSQQIAALKTQLSAFGGGLDEYTDGVSKASLGVGELSSALGLLKSGGAKLKTGASGLAKGSEKLSSGAKELSRGAAQLPGALARIAAGQLEIKKGVDSQTGALSDYNFGSEAGAPVSFADSSRTVRTVSFVMTMPEIKKPKEQVPEANESTPKSFWDKLAALFT